MTIPQLRQQIGAQLGLAIGDGSASAFGNLSQADQLRMTIAMHDAIRAAPGQFSASAVAGAFAGTFTGTEDYTLGDAASDFAGEFVNQAQQLNPLSTVNRKLTLWILVGLAVVAIVAWVLPSTLAARRARQG